MAMNRLVHSAQFHLTSCHKFCEVEAAQQCLIGGSLLLSAGPASKQISGQTAMCEFPLSGEGPKLDVHTQDEV